MPKFLEDAKATWQKLPPAGKIAIGGGIGVFILWLAYTHSKGGTTSASGLTASGLPATSGTTQASSAYPGVQSGDSNVPVFPAGINPLFDPQGGLIAFQQQQASVSPPPSNTPSGPNPLAYMGLIGANANVNFKNRTYVDSTGKSVPLPIGAQDKLVQGSDNRVWYTDNGGQHLLTSGKGPAINPTTNKPFVGGGGESLPSYVRSLTHYNVQYGDNLHRVASQLRIPGGLPAWLAHNGNPETFEHGMRLEIPR